MRVVAWGVAVVTACLLGAGSPAVADEVPQPDLAYPADPPRQEAYERGLAEGYDDGLRDAREQADLQGDVQDEAEQAEPTASPSPTPSPTAAAVAPAPDPAPEESGGGFPWWPLAFATVASVWFVTRRRREDVE